MLAKCANPTCTTELRYLRDGKIFLLELEPELTPGPQSIDSRKPARRVEHFWLCGPCSADMTLVTLRGKGVTAVPKIRAASVRHAAAS
jgi:hypothetical protein